MKGLLGNSFIKNIEVTGKFDGFLKICFNEGSFLWIEGLALCSNACGKYNLRFIKNIKQLKINRLILWEILTGKFEILRATAV